tara:strand:+ start:724 stop:1347 length:624 start_codon:yes stop_codon:yes gene_type:complete
MKTKKLAKTGIIVVITLLMNSCASSYSTINPDRLNYISNDISQEVTLEYKYGLLESKYAKKEVKRGVRLIAVKITNNSKKDLVFGKDITLTYENGNELSFLENKKTYSTLKQNTLGYLFYLLLTPMTFNKTSATNNGIETNSTPIGYAVGPGLAFGNMIAAGSANKKFKKELLDYNIFGTTINSGKTVVGLIGVYSYSYDALKLKIE